MKIEVVSLTPQIAVASKRTAVTMENIHEAIGEMSARLLSYLSQQGKGMSGPPYLKYMNMSPDFSEFDIEWGFPVEEPVPASGEFYMSQTYGGRAIVATHKGPYSILEEAYSAIMKYEREYALKNTGVYYDVYLNDADETPEDELLTQVVCPIE